MAQVNIMVVDDLKSIRLTLGGILEDKGYNVVTVEDGFQAIESARKTHFDAIFMDIKMPGIDGVQTFREIKKIAPDTTVIMMTAYSIDELIKEAMDEGAYNVIFKPFEITKIVSLIDELLDEKKMILVVDDHFADRKTLKEILESKGYRVATAANGSESLEMVRENHYDIIFLDIKMPGMNGAETFEHIKKIAPSAAVIMMTGYSVEELVRKTLSGGAHACIYKPFDMENVISIVDGIGN